MKNSIELWIAEHSRTILLVVAALSLGLLVGYAYGVGETITTYAYQGCLP